MGEKSGKTSKIFFFSGKLLNYTKRGKNILPKQDRFFLITQNKNSKIKKEQVL